MDLLMRVLASLIRRVLTGAAVTVLGILVAKGFLGVELRDEVMAWLSGPATAWIATLLVAAGGAGLTWADKYIAKVKERVAGEMIAHAATNIPSNVASLMSAPVNEDEIVAQARQQVPAILRPFVRAA